MEGRNGTPRDDDTGVAEHRIDTIIKRSGGESAPPSFLEYLNSDFMPNNFLPLGLVQYSCKVSCGCGWLCSVDSIFDLSDFDTYP